MSNEGFMEAKNGRGKNPKRLLMAGALLFGIGYVVLKPVYGRFWYAANKSTCSERLKDIGLAIRLYAKDSDNVLPPVFSSSEKVGWAGALQPYVKSSLVGPIRSGWIYECPFDATKHSNSPSQPGFTDYWYNANVMQKTPRGAACSSLNGFEICTTNDSGRLRSLSDCRAKFDATFNQCGDGTSLFSAYQLCKSASGRTAVFPVMHLTTMICLSIYFLPMDTLNLFHRQPCFMIMEQR